MTEAELLSRRLSPRYNCAHFLCDAWQHETGDDIRDEMVEFLHPPSERTTPAGLGTRFRRLEHPVAPCVVLLRRARGAPHVGLFTRGRMLHLTDHGPVRQLVAVARIGYTSLRYYGHR